MYRTRTHFTNQLAGTMHVFRMLRDEMRPDSPKSMYTLQAPGPDMAMPDVDDEDQLSFKSMFQVFRCIGPTVIIVTARVLLRWKVRYTDPQIFKSFLRSPVEGSSINLTAAVAVVLDHTATLRCAFSYAGGSGTSCSPA